MNISVPSFPVKRLIIFILSFVYLSASAGVKINLFYCCGQLERISLFEQQASDDCEGFIKKNCCDSKSALFKIRDEQKSASINHLEFKPILVDASLPTYTFHWIPSVTGSSHHTQKTLSDSSPPYYILYCVYRI